MWTVCNIYAMHLSHEKFSLEKKKSFCVIQKSQKSLKHLPTLLIFSQSSIIHRNIPDCYYVAVSYVIVAS